MMNIFESIGFGIGYAIESVKIGYWDGRKSPYKDDALRQVRLLVEAGVWIEAIKKHRELFGSTLKEAKDIVDEMRTTNSK